MLVLKFGGTSLENSQRYKKAADTVRRLVSYNPLVVVSAMGGVTARIQKAAEEALRGQSLLNDVLTPQQTVIRELGLRPADFYDLYEGQRASLERIATLAALTPAALDHALQWGELISARVLAKLLNKMGTDACDWDAADAGFITDGNHGAARPLSESARTARQWWETKGDDTAIVTGFIGRNRDGARTTSGKGGSDLTAAWYAAHLDARELQIWTDVSGVMTADPRLVENARTIRSLSFGEASEMAFRGARVLHPDTLRPVREAGIPVRVLNSFSPADTGTSIVDGAPSPGIRCIASQRDLLVWRFWEEFGTEKSALRIRSLEIFAEFGLDPIQFSAYESGFAAVTPFNSDYTKALAQLIRIAPVECYKRRSLISLVGNRIASNASVAARALQLLADSQTVLDLVSSSATGHSFSIVLPDEQLEDALRTLHVDFFETDLSGDSSSDGTC
ncbi:MAG: aspartate kinase [Planctomycetota bacterium]|nr:aspartate kinase [Planctomycetota bacterium]